MDKTFDFIIYAYPRTGNTYLGYTLNRHPKILCIPELYGGHYHRKELPTFKNALDHIERHLWLTKKIKINRNNNILDEILNQKNNLITGTTIISSNIRHGPKNQPNIHYLNEINKNKDIKKIILVRDPLQTYISAKIAKKSTHWVWMDTSDVKINFDLSEFKEHCNKVNRYYYSILESIKNQTFLVVDYNTVISSIKIILDFLKVENIKLEIKNTVTKKQNSQNILDQVLNYEQMQKDLLSIKTKDPIFTNDTLL